MGSLRRWRFCRGHSDPTEGSVALLCQVVVIAKGYEQSRRETHLAKLGFICRIGQVPHKDGLDFLRLICGGICSPWLRERDGQRLVAQPTISIHTHEFAGRDTFARSRKSYTHELSGLSLDPHLRRYDLAGSSTCSYGLSTPFPSTNQRGMEMIALEVRR